jgi:hypothetical protein
MTTTSSVTQKKAVKASKASNLVQTLESLVHENIVYFPELAKVYGIEGFFTSLMYVESTFLPWRAGPTVSTNPGTSGHDYVTDPVYTTQIASGASRYIMDQGLSGWGLGQCMGWYLIRGTRLGKQIVQNSTYSPIAERNGIIVNPGTDLRSVFTNNNDGMIRGVVAGLIVLDFKYNVYLKHGRDPEDAFTKALQGYLGKNGAKDVLGSDPVSYANKIKNMASSGLYGKIAFDDTMAASTNSSTVAKPSPGCT